MLLWHSCCPQLLRKFPVELNPHLLHCQGTIVFPHPLPTPSFPMHHHVPPLFPMHQYVLQTLGSPCTVMFPPTPPHPPGTPPPPPPPSAESTLTHVPTAPLACRLLSFCGYVAARLPFKRCDEPYTLLHLINATISRRAAFVLSAQKASLDATLQQEAKPAADTTTASHRQEGHAGGHAEGHAGGHAGPQGSGAAAPEDGDRVTKSDGGAQHSIMGGGAEAAPADTPGHSTGDQVGFAAKPPVQCLYMVLSLYLLLHAIPGHLVHWHCTH